MMCCPECGEWFISATVWSGPDHAPVAGVLCPHCGAFIADDEFIGDDDPTDDQENPTNDA